MSAIGVDFDGVIHAYSKGWHDSSIYDSPTPGAWFALQQIQRAGHAVFVFTSRDTLAVQAWLVDKAPAELGQILVDPAASGNGGPQFWDDRSNILVTNRKLPAVAYIDDRAVRHVAWPATIRQLSQSGLL